MYEHPETKFEEVAARFMVSNFVVWWSRIGESIQAALDIVRAVAAACLPYHLLPSMTN
jgi:hypothetical protein